MADDVNRKITRPRRRVRFVRSHKRAIEVRVMYLRHEDGRYVCLAPMMHVADQQFWDRVNTAVGKLAKKKYVGFYEGIYSKAGPLLAGDQVRLEKLNSAFGLTTGGEETTREISKLFRSRSRKQAAASIGKVHQLAGFRPAVRGVNADVSTWDLLPVFSPDPRRMLTGGGRSWLLGLLTAGSILRGIVVAAQPWVLRMTLGRRFTEYMIDRRNARLVEMVLANPGRSLIPWGAAHMPGIYRLLLDAGFVPSKEQWLVVATHEDAAGVRALSPHVRG